MPKTISIGCQDFETIRTEEYFYIDKTHFIKDWWEGGDSVTLITRPRRFGKTLTLSMVEKFFSVEYAGRTELFEGLSLWKEEKYRELQGTCPVISLSFAQVKETTCFNAKKKICQIITNQYNKFDFLLDSGKLNEKEKNFISRFQWIWKIILPPNGAFGQIRTYLHPRNAAKTSKLVWAI